MNEPLKFRGFNYKHKKLVTGYYFVNRGRHFIANDELVSLAAQADDFAVDPVTVGMSTGRVDANGREIFELDILASRLRPLSFLRYAVRFDRSRSAFVAVPAARLTGPYISLARLLEREPMVVVGDITTTPEVFNKGRGNYVYPPGDL